jgi:hypothetical protein
MRFTGLLLPLLLIAPGACSRSPRQVAGDQFELRGEVYTLSPEPGVILGPEPACCDFFRYTFYFTSGQISSSGGFAGRSTLDWDSLRRVDREQMATIAESAVRFLDRLEKDQSRLSEVDQLHRRILRGFLAVYRRGAAAKAQNSSLQKQLRRS